MEKMDDEFLGYLREQPDPAFARSLYQNINRPDLPLERESSRSSLLTFYHQRTKLAWVVFLIVAGFTVIALVASPVRAFVKALLIDVAGLSFQVTDTYPGGNSPVKIINPRIMSLEEALSIFPHEVKIPSYIPSGCSLDETNARIYTGEEAVPFADTLELDWKPKPCFSLTIRTEVAEIVASESIEEITLDAEHSAVLIRGGWNADIKEWDTILPGIRLKWQVGDLTYDLHGSEKIILEDLIEIARSTLEE
jgi:hypothetical protein